MPLFSFTILFLHNETPFLFYNTCLLYTSDAADEARSVDLGGRRIIKKKKVKQHVSQYTLLSNKHR
ncbi:hypothetical protein PVA38_11180 [Streptococcus pneumoniae D39]|nr:hypothetical protein PVA38_11180 [Streptococcus pneumoniae D39]